MSTIVIEVPSVLAATLAGQRRLEVPLPREPTMRGLLDELDVQYPLFGRRVRDERGDVRRYVNIFIGQDNIIDLEGLESTVHQGHCVLIMQSVAGG
ncbi:molybdopterin synthase sulfur carrier subunit [Paeniglutamicibacter antarcticus]|uniref:Molybdopterin synthase subunit MoaD n=1 Tax=Paeniglutamicibacter antarcticus TaxID=494023 RepID=A0ABP9TJK1_9MICC